MKKYIAKGIIEYKDDGWIILTVHSSIINYYRATIEKRIGKKLSTSYHGGHVTVVAGKYDTGLQKHYAWKNYDKKVIHFEYIPEILTDNEWFFLGKYFWMRIDAPFLRYVRTELGLKPEPFHPYHVTIGYCGY